MPRATESNPQDQLAKPIIIGDGKCGKTRWAAEAALAGFNVLYVDGDVASQTIASLPREARERIFILNSRDKLVNGGLNHDFVDFMGQFFTAKGSFLWNDSKSRLFSRVLEGDSTPDQIWQIFPTRLNENWVLVIDSWTSLVQSAMAWAAEDMGIKLEAIDESARKNMRTLYQIGGEKLTQYLITIRSMPCHVIVIAHPNEFVKLEKPSGKTIAGAKEGEMKILWTKMVPKSITNPHSLTIAKYFTDVAWLEVSAMGDFMIDFRPSPDRMSGSHMNGRFKSSVDGRFIDLVTTLGGAAPKGLPADSWQDVITIHDGYEAAPNKVVKPLVLGESKSQTVAAPVASPKALNFNLATKRN